MKKISLAIILSFIFIIASSTISSAHPGRTDSNGGHYCRTNCEKWGLNYDEYHYHNGGNSNSSSSSSNSTNKAPALSTPVTPPEPKLSYTQVDVDEGNEAGKDEGYEHGYGRKDNSSATDHSNEGYRIGYAKGYEVGYADGLKKINEEDREEGFEKGVSAGKKAARSGKLEGMENDESKSSEWNISFEKAFNSAFDEEENVINIEEEGYLSGYDLEDLTFPEFIHNDEKMSGIYEKHYKEGFEKRSQEETKIHFELGYENGYNLLDKSLSEFDERFGDSYQDGYQEGYEKIKSETVDKGYLLAFQMMNYEQPGDVSQAELLEWYEEGFISNVIAEQIKSSANNYGYENKDYYIPEEFKENADSISLYDELFFEGQEVRREENRNQLIYVGTGISAIGVVGGGGYYLRKRKKKSNKNKNHIS